MIILSVKEEYGKLHYKFNSESHEGVIFNILVEYKIAEENNQKYFICDYEELEHTKNNNKIDIDDSKKICDFFLSYIAESLYESLVKGESRVSK